MSVYQFCLAVYKILPFKNVICKLISLTKIPNQKFYQDLKFNGKFIVKVDYLNKFSLYHHGGTIENEIFWKGLFTTFEPEMGWIWLKLSAISDTIFDIGANTGVYSLIAKAVNKKANIYAFEPSNNTFSKLVLNNEINHFDIRCEQLAISNKNDQENFYDVFDGNQTSASLSPEMYKNRLGNDILFNEYQVQSIRLSDYIVSNNIISLDLVKLDIEMHEPAAIEGFGQYLNEFKPYVLIEVLSDDVALKLNALIDSNHLIFHLEGKNKIRKLNRFEYIPNQWNFLFFHPDKAQKIQEALPIFKEFISEI